jgi:hypothetical protein
MQSLARDLQALLEIFQGQKRHFWRDIWTLYKSLVHFTTSEAQIWLAWVEPSTDRRRHTIPSLRFMIAVVWGITGFHILKLPQKGINLTRTMMSTKFCKRLIIGEKDNEERTIENWPSILIRHRPIWPGVVCDMLSHERWLDHATLHTDQIWHLQTSFHSVTFKNRLQGEYIEMEEEF